MSLFTKATIVERYLKVLVYGPPGSGKTWFALSFTKAGRTAVIDTEGGTSLYGGKFDFDVLRTKDFAQVLAAVAEIKADGGKIIKTLVIDPITVLWGTLQDGGQQMAEKRQNKSGGVVDVVLTQRDWGIIKRQYNKLMTELVNLRCHVVIVAREKDIIGADDKRQGVRPDAEKSTPYLPDIILRFEGGKGYTAIVEKDRSGLFTLGSKITDPSYATFAAAVSHGVDAPLPDDDAAAHATAALLAAQDAPVTRQEAQQQGAKAQRGPIATASTVSVEGMATERQITSIRKLCAALGRREPDTATMTFNAARDLLTQLSAAYCEARQAS